jgi:glycosyltransferase involved in cell wall biosynthesis
MTDVRLALLVSSSGWGGMEIHTARLARTLAERGHEVTLVELDQRVFDPAQFNGAAVRVVAPGFGRPSAEVGYLAWRRYFRGLGCDAALFEKGNVHVGSAVLDLAARSAFRRYFVLEQLDPPRRPQRASKRHLGGLVPGLGLWWYKAVWGVRLRYVGPHRVVTVSRPALEELQRYGCPAEKLVAIPNGVDVDRNRPDPALRAAARERWGVPAEAVVFGTVARLAYWHKGQDIAIEQFAELLRRTGRRDVWYVLVGDGPDRERLETQARTAGVGDRVLFTGYSEQPWEAHCGIDFPLLASRFEGTPLALAEAMAAGSVPIAMSVGGMPDLIPSEAIGWLVPSGDRPGFLAALEAALALTSAARRTMGARAREHVVAQFNGAVQYGKVAALLEGAKRGAAA